MRKMTRLWVWAMATGVLAGAHRAAAQVREPFGLLDQEPDNVYLPPAPPTPDQLTNQGGVNFSLDISYLTRYVYRGVDQTTPPLHTEQPLQFDGKLEFNLGKLPHPFIGVFANVFNNDPISRFEEIRPYAGLEWTLRPIILSGGYNSYIFPDRKPKDTQEVWSKIVVDDSRFFHTERPVLSPYVYGAYDFDKFNGFYIEAGLKHDFIIGDTGLVLTTQGDAAYVIHDRYFLLAPGNQVTGFQHYDIGLTATYSLNTALNLPRRYGEWQLKGYLFYTDGLSSHLRGDTRIWGGIGIGFRY
jgi:hypothetical protein